jgi:hypothetical protein
MLALKGSDNDVAFDLKKKISDSEESTAEEYIP